MRIVVAKLRLQLDLSTWISSMLRRLTIAYIGLLTCMVVAADLGLMSPFFRALHNVPFGLGDKLCHFFLVGMLCFFVSATLTAGMKRRRKRTVILSTIAVLAVLATLEECSQSLFASRSFSRFDMLANVSGIVTFGMLAWLIPWNRSELSARPFDVQR